MFIILLLQNALFLTYSVLVLSHQTVCKCDFSFQKQLKLLKYLPQRMVRFVNKNLLFTYENCGCMILISRIFFLFMIKWNSIYMLIFFQFKNTWENAWCWVKEIILSLLFTYKVLIVQTRWILCAIYFIFLSQIACLVHR